MRDSIWKGSWKAGALKNWQAFERQIWEGNGFLAGKSRLLKAQKTVDMRCVLVTVVRETWGLWNGLNRRNHRWEDPVIDSKAAEKEGAEGRVWMILNARCYCCLMDSGAQKVFELIRTMLKAPWVNRFVLVKYFFILYFVLREKVWYRKKPLFASLQWKQEVKRLSYWPPEKNWEEGDGARWDLLWTTVQSKLFGNRTCFSSKLYPKLK